MPSGRSRRGWEGSLARVIGPILVAVLIGSGLVGCSPGSESEAAGAATTEGVVDEVTTLMNARARAVREGDLVAFTDGLAQRRRRLVRAQEDYFLNLRELPLARFRYVVSPDSVTTEGGRVRAVIQLRMQLEEFDSVPAESRSLFTFVRAPAGRLRIAAVRDAAFDEEHDLEPAPWEIGKIVVTEGEGVLGVFDADSADAAYQIIDAVESGIEEVDRVLPWSWSERVVVYALSDTTFLSSIDDLPGGDPDGIDAVAFPVHAAGDGERLAATRFMLHPRMIHRDGLVRDRLIRHELTHVALGQRDDRVPIWLSEGIADHVAAHSVPDFNRTIARAAVRAAREGIEALPAGEEFNGESAAANYGVSWQASAHIADTYGEEVLWQLLDEMRAGGGTSESEQDEVLQRVVGIDSRELAHAAERRILATFG